MSTCDNVRPIMRPKIHPEYTEATIACACGNVMQVNSTRKSMEINTCSACHPFYTGKAAFIDAAGRVEQFRKRYGKK
jgi:large subunit ribosomal protein L31